MFNPIRTDFINCVVCILIFSSCFDSNRLKGEWVFLYNEDDNPGFNYLKLNISKDSIHLLDEFQQESKYLLQVNSRELVFANKNLPYTIAGGGSLVIQGSCFTKNIVKDSFDPHLLDISLPSFSGNIDLTNALKNPYQVILLGRKPTTGEFAIQLNDVYASHDDIFLWLDTGHGPDSSIILAIDKFVKMEDVERIFETLRMMNSRRVIFLSSDSLSYFGRATKGLQTVIRPFLLKERKKNEGYPPQVYLEIMSMLKGKGYQLVDIRKKKPLLGSGEIKLSSLANELLQKLRQTPKTLTVLIYGLDQNFEQYILARKMISKVYSQYRDGKSIAIYGVKTSNLTQNQLRSFNKNYPYNYIDLDESVWNKITTNF